ncbi:MAG: hypothetical protein ACQEXQ_29175 [Bacillota bacterium]
MTIEHENGPLYIWTVEGEDTAIFWYDKGRLYISRAQDHVIEKMIDLASKLNAKVEGDEGEIYYMNERQGFLSI